MASWRRIVFAIPHELQETLVVCLHELGSLGAQIEDERVVAWFGIGLDEAALLWSIAERLGGGTGLGVAGSETVEDGHWHERWMERLAPFAVGERFLLVPGPVTPRDTGGRQVIRLTPGRAFGTGEHATTRMCVSLMEQTVRPGESLLDVGTGSGILAIAAHKLGASPVIGIDIDASCLPVAARNLELNDAAAVRLMGGTLDALVRARFHRVVANISAPALVRLMGRLAATARREAILSGLLIEDEPELVVAAARVGFTPARRLSEGDWVALALSRGSDD